MWILRGWVFILLTSLVLLGSSLAIAKDLFSDIPLSSSNTISQNTLDWSTPETAPDLSEDSKNNIIVQNQDYHFPALDIVADLTEKSDFIPYIENNNDYPVNLAGWKLLYSYQLNESWQEFSQNSFILPNEKRLLESQNMISQYGSLSNVSNIKLYNPAELLEAKLDNPYYQTLFINKADDSDLDKDTPSKSNIAKANTKTTNKNTKSTTNSPNKSTTKASTKTASKTPAKSTKSTTKANTIIDPDSDTLGNAEQLEPKNNHTSGIIYLITGLIIVYCIYEYRLELANFWRPKQLKTPSFSDSKSNPALSQATLSDDIFSSGSSGIWQNLVYKTDNK